MPQLIVEQYNEQETINGKIGHLAGRLVTRNGNPEKNAVLRVVPSKEWWGALVGKTIRFPNNYRRIKSYNQFYEKYHSIQKFRWVHFFFPKDGEAFRWEEITLA